MVLPTARNSCTKCESSVKIGSLFSGIGGLELGLEMSGLGDTAWQVELDPACQEVLAKRWPRATRYDCIQNVGNHNLSPVDILCGGFPCQDVSGAGKSTGISGSRSGLWTEFARIIGELKPEWIVVENVASGAKQWVNDVIRDLGRQGYDALPIPITAQDVSAPHLRRRVFIVAHSNRFPIRNQSEWMSWRREIALQGKGKAFAVDEGSPGHLTRAPGWQARPEIRGVDDGLPRRVDRLKQLGNSVVPECAEVIGWVIRELANI